MALAVTLATCAQLPEDNGPPRNCLSTQAGQTELRDLLTTVLRNKSIIFPTGANGIIDGGLFEVSTRQLCTPYMIVLVCTMVVLGLLLKVNLPCTLCLQGLLC